jgi:O-glycosyl hydrolase
MKTRVAFGQLALIASALVCSMCGNKPSQGGGHAATGGQLSKGGSGDSRTTGGASGTGGVVTGTSDAAASGGSPGTGGGPATGDARSAPDAAPITTATGGASGLGGSTDARDRDDARTTDVGVFDVPSFTDARLAGGAGGRGGAIGTGGRPTVVAATGTTLVKVDARTKHQTFEGWGTSLAWWAYQIGGWSASKRNQLVDLIVDPVAGLGYNVFRYKIGGGDAPGHKHMDANRQMPGFQSSDGTWDWNADARQTAVLTRLASSGQNVLFEAFSNSPPYWMTKSGCASGSTDGSNNLKDDAYETFAGYLADVVKHHRDSLGINFRTLEAMNEPNANWWKANGSQEGCHVGASSQPQLIKAVSAALAARGLTGTQVSASDENSMDDAYSIVGGYDSATMAALSQINVHSYAGSKRTQLRTLATSKAKRLWQSESGPLSVDLATTTDAAIFMAGRIIQDLRELQPEAWIEWQTVDPSPNWTNFTVNDSQQTWTPVKRFYMQAGFTRYIRPGAVFVDVNNADMIAAVSADGATLTLVVRNGDSAASKGFTFDLTSLPSLAGTVDSYRTSAKEDLVHLPALTAQDWSFTATIPAYSVTTFVIAL